MENIKNIISLIDSSIKENPELNITEWEIIAAWYDEKVDYYRWLINNSKDWLTWYQTKISNDYNISSLKIKYSWNSGYFIEIPKSQISKMPDTFFHKQTLVNSARFVTDELKEFEKDILEAEQKKAELEYNIFLDIREKILDNFNDIKNISENISYIDFISSLSEVSYYNNFVKPELHKKYDLSVLGWRHPIVEQNEKDFISNNLDLNSKKYVHIITGPNMWWKSTFLRQNAIIILLSHIGCFVPAKKATIPLVDKIFSRIWASDNLFSWQSTFMVEMEEVANILNNSTKNSFVIIDEVGRWTSTYDWMSLAWAILKENHDNIKAKTLFATHYHELIDESKKLSWVENFSVAVWENEENLVFLRKIIPWWIKKSFWLEVAKIAWLSSKVISEAKNMLYKLEKDSNNVKKQMFLWDFKDKDIEVKYIEKESEVEKELKKIDLNNITPIDALNKISELKNKI